MAETWTTDYAERLVAEWRQKADEYERDGATAQAAVYRRNADELDAARAAYLGEELPMRRAVEESGFSSKHLGRLRKSGEWSGTRRDLPRRPGHVRAPRPQAVSDRPSLTDRVLAARGGAARRVV